MRTIAQALLALIVPYMVLPVSAQFPSVPVELELVLAVDTSASVNGAEYQLQMDGIANAFRDRDVIAAIEAYKDAGIAVTMVHWSAKAAQVIDWMHVLDGNGDRRIAGQIERTPRAVLGVTTGIGSALAVSIELLSGNRFSGRRRSIDVSGDGMNNSGLPLWIERTRSVSSGITVNGLAILGEDPNLAAYYRDHVIAGPGAFMVTANNFDDFARAFRKKLLREIQAVFAETGARKTKTASRLGEDRATVND